MDTIAKRMKNAMLIRNITQADLIKSTGITKSSISSYINGKYEPKHDNIYKIAKALNVSESWLMGFDVPMERLSTTPSSYVPETIAAHFEGQEFSEEDLSDIARFIEFIAAKHNGKS